MPDNRPARFVAIAIGAAVLFGLELGFDVKVYVAIPAGVLAYLATRFGMGLMLDADSKTK